MTVAIYLEESSRRTFAGSLDWPGWSRSGRDADEAVAVLLAAAPRYRAALERVGLAFAEPRPDELRVVERFEGDAGTDFGVPSRPPKADGEPVDGEAVERHAMILEAAWRAFEAAAEEAAGRELRLGPRGGGRDLPRIVQHVREAQAAYLRQLGARPPRDLDPPRGPEGDRLRERSIEAFRARATGAPLADPTRVRHPWSPRTYLRRSVWHLLDHAWEIEDRVLPGGPAQPTPSARSRGKSAAE